MTTSTLYGILSIVSFALIWVFAVVAFVFTRRMRGHSHVTSKLAVGTLSARPENRAVGMALFYSLYYAGGAVGPAVCGWVADRHGGPAGGVLAAAAISALIIPLFLLHRKLARHEVMLVQP